MQKAHTHSSQSVVVMILDSCVWPTTVAIVHCTARTVVVEVEEVVVALTGKICLISQVVVVAVIM